MIGTTLSHYSIEAELGRGGMGIVYKARDTKLDREVAIKVLPSAALASADDRERFYREAKSAAALNHPNIAQVYQIDEAVPSDAPHGTEPSPFIAMEYIAGGTLQDKIKEKPLSLPDAVKIASQVAEALKAAHAKDIVHRDIKSANVMITEDGIAKVLDFGLAKTNQSTMLTRMGSTLGTVAYMSPEQARGQEVDGRTDLYSLGTMLYEMVAGRLPFAGEYEQAVVYSILNEPPEPLTSLRTGVPMDLERVVNKLLAKDAEYRYQSAAGLLSDLKSLDLSGSGHSRQSMPAATASHSLTPGTVQKSVGTPWILAGVAGLLLGAFLVWFLKPEPKTTDGPQVRFSIPAQERTYFGNWNAREVALSPDGKLLAFASSNDGIRLVRLDDLGNETTLRGTESGAVEIQFSPDSRWISYVDIDNRRLMKVNVSGGTPRLLADISVIRRVRGSYWADNGYIYFVTQGEDFWERVARVSAEGGQMEFITDLEVDIGYRVANVHMLPGGRFLLYTTGRRGEGWSLAEIWAYDVENGESHLVITNGNSPVYLPTGHLVFISGNSLFAALFDPGSATVIGESVPVVDKVWAPFENGATPAFAVSSNGILIKLRGESTQIRVNGSTPSWVEPDGSTVPWNPDRFDYQHVELSPDGSQAFVVEGNVFIVSESKIWLMNTTLGTKELIRTGGSSPVWHPDGDHYAVSDETGKRILRTSLSNPTSVDTLFESESLAEPTDWSKDGSTIILNVGDLGSTDIWILDVESGQGRPFRQSNEDDDYAQLSPDGQWIAYETGQARETAIVVQRFPSGTNRIVAAEGAAKVRWHPDGNRIYTINYDSKLSAVDLDLQAGEAGEMVELTEADASPNWQFDLHPISGRPVILERESPVGDLAESEQVWDIYVNWFSALPEGE